LVYFGFKIWGRVGSHGGLVEESFHGSSQSGIIIWIPEYAIDTVFDEFGDASNVWGDHGAACSTGFEDY
jgi:hypothetical protein